MLLNHSKAINLDVARPIKSGSLLAIDLIVSMGRCFYAVCAYDAQAFSLGEPRFIYINDKVGIFRRFSRSQLAALAWFSAGGPQEKDLFLWL